MISGGQYAKYFSILLLMFIALALWAAGNKLNNKMLKYFCILPLKSLNICYLFIKSIEIHHIKFLYFLHKLSFDWICKSIKHYD